MFHFLMEDGGLWWRAPISAFCTKPGVKELPLDELVMWIVLVIMSVLQLSMN